MELTGKIKEIFENEFCHQLATASLDGAPNVSNVGAKYIREDGKIVIVDNYMRKTKKNILENPTVAIMIRRKAASYQIKGSCEYLTEGEQYEQAKKWMKERGDRFPAKGALLITIESIWDSSSGATAGDRVL